MEGTLRKASIHVFFLLVALIILLEFWCSDCLKLTSVIILVSNPTMKLTSITELGPAENTVTAYDCCQQ